MEETSKHIKQHNTEKQIKKNEPKEDFNNNDHDTNYKKIVSSIKSFIKAHKVTSVIMLAIILLTIGININIAKNNIRLEEYDVKGLTIKEACEKVKNAGWSVERVVSQEYDDKTDCYNTDIIVTDYYYHKYNNSVVIYFGEKKSEEEKKAECEATGKWYRDKQCKSQEEWENDYAWKNAHAACKKYGSSGYAKTLTDCYIGNDYVGSVDGQPATNTDITDKSEEEKAEQEKKEAEDKAAKEEAERKASEEAAKKAEEEKKKAVQDSGEELPDSISPYDIQALCERGFESLGYTNANIKLTNQYAMGYPPYIYVVVGTLSTKAGITSSRKQVGTIQCQANWQTWTIKSLTINGTQVY